MRLKHTIRLADACSLKDVVAWAEQNVGTLGVDFIPVVEHKQDFDDDGNLIFEGPEFFWDIPDNEKVFLWKLRWGL